MQRRGPWGWLRGRRWRLFLVGWWAAALFVTSEGRADLGSDVARILSGYTRHGVRVAHLGTVYLHETQQRVVGVPPPGSADGACQTVIGLAERQVSFSLRADPPEAAAGRTAARSSRAGVAALTGCGAARRSLRRVQVSMLSGGGAVELLVARHDGRLPSFDEIVPERALGLVAASPTLGRPRRSEPLVARVRRAGEAARFDGAAVVVPVGTRASADGTGALGLNLSAGCHRLSLLADEAGSEPLDEARDLDAELRLRGASTALRQDRSHAPDARLEFCLGEASEVELRYLGAGGAVDVVVMAALWRLPRAAAMADDPAERAAIAWALFRRRTPQPGEPAILRLRGGPGATIVPVRVEPGACYLAVMALTTGQAGAARLSAVIGERTVRDQSTEQPLGAAVTFCTDRQRDVTLRAELRAGFGWWLLGLWRLTGGEP